MARLTQADPAQLELTLKPRRKPAYVAREGNVKVPVYKYSDARWCVAWRQVAGGPRLRVTYEHRADAVKKADETARAIANSQADVTTLSSATRDDYRLAMQELPAGVPLHAAVQEYAAARALVAPHTLLEAARYFAEGMLRLKVAPPTATIAAELLVQLRADRRDELAHVRRLELDLERFAVTFPRLETATEKDLRAYLGNLRTMRQVRDPLTGELLPKGALVSARRRDNVRDAIVELSRFAQAQGYLACQRDETPAERIPKLAHGREPTTYTPEQVGQILNYFAAHDSVWLPWAAIAAFAGLRTSEIFRLGWDRVKWAEGVISVHASVAKKVRVSRKPPLSEALAAWLAGYKGATGPVIERKWKDMHAAHADALERLRTSLGWKVWHTNALRHSYGSHRLAICKSEAQVALEMGNSVAKVREDYNDPKSEGEAARYFGLRPADAGKIVAFKEA